MAQLFKGFVTTHYTGKIVKGLFICGSLVIISTKLLMSIIEYMNNISAFAVLHACKAVWCKGRKDGDRKSVHMQYTSILVACYIQPNKYPIHTNKHV